ncbi:acyltransferase [Mucilaginibacter flavidus]|uniref:acyltransferase n=1 Tax=Mucilaginibacter flavidus TaxID=2949309 RepID=UPI0020925D19|nr:acyltransferase family protein [Mucilaginibacter flavidus]MCO5947493.1 acyltransferase family protein [Mucilaginibacter flavidus]
MADKSPEKPKNRFYYIDFLRALAIFAVIILHNSADAAGQYGKIPETDWLSAAFYNGLTRCCVPMFVLLSGALLLKPDRDVTIKELFRKRLPKLVIPLVVWSIIYEAFQFYTDKGYGTFNLLSALKTFYQGPLVFHFWFLYMMIGIYLVYPIINTFIRAATKSQVQYFIAVWFITNCVCGIIGIATGLSIAVELNFFTGYIGYFVLGYYINNYIFTAPQLKLIYAGCAFAFVVSISGIILLQTFRDKGFNEIIESDFTPDIPFALAGVFLLIKNRTFNLNPTWWQKLVTEISAESYGIYIVHVLFLRLLFDKIYLNLAFKNQSLLWIVPVKSIAVLGLSYGLTKLIRLVPWLRMTV